MNISLKDIPYEKFGLNPEKHSPVLIPFTLNYSPELGKRKRPCVIICPGGGYEFLSDRENQAVAMRFASYGINAFVLKYSVKSPFPAALLELACAVKYVRENAEKYDIDPDATIVCGFSAGGHLCASLGTLYNSYLDSFFTPSEIKPDAMLLSYPVITSGKYCHSGSIESILGKNPTEELLKTVSLEKQVNAGTPKTFIWHNADDKTVPVENTIDFIKALSENNIVFESHIFPYGGHGLALADESTAKHEAHMNSTCAQWFNLAIEWIKREFNTVNFSE
ncbi:MAG: alpha/beta hydrolase [Oscillospiraceae bacterium]|nr:alpha/beta hydrolase [Oscillospiraceae bacterium]